MSPNQRLESGSSLRTQLFWAIVLSSKVSESHCFEGTCHLYLLGEGVQVS